MSKEKDEISATQLVLGVLLLPFLTIMHGFVFMKLWAWFVVPVFHTPTMGLNAAIGIACVAGFIQHSASTDKKSLLETMGLSLLRTLLYLAVGGIILLFS